MESGNSSSMQSSSGGDDQEYESSGGLIATSSSNYYSNVGNNNNHPNMFMLSSAQQPPPSQPPLLPPSQPPHLQQGNYLDALETQSGYHQNFMFWQQQQQHLGGGGGGGAGLFDHLSVNHPSCTADAAHLGGGGGGGLSSVQSALHHQQSGNNNSPKASTSQQAGGGSAGVSVGGAGGSGKNPRKRTRASRRAPTTVLTTDTSNFRAMVQEFTGIPSSPFSAAASPLLSRRLSDLLAGTASSAGPALRPGPQLSMVGPGTSSLERLLAGYNSSNYPLRPSAHKINTTTDNSNSNSNNPPHNINSTSNPSTFSALGNFSIQSLLQQSTAAPSALRFQPSQQASANQLLTPNVGNFPELSGVVGSETMFGFAPMRVAPDSGGWRGGSSGGGGVAPSNEEGGDHGGGNINIGVEKVNNNNNEEMAGSISGGGTSNYDVNMNCSRDKSLDNSTPNRGGAQGTLGDFLG